MDHSTSGAAVAPAYAPRPLVAASSHARVLMLVGRITLAASLLGMGALGLVFGDFALQWQPVPEGLPERRLLAYAAAIVEAALGVALLAPRILPVAAAAVGVWFLLWTILLRGPAVLAAPLEVVSWLGFTEALEVAAGALLLWAAASRSSLARWGSVAGRLAFGACLPVFGLSHFAYAQFTADMIPGWIPFHLFWAYFTGVAHVAAGISILTGVLARLGSLLFAVMVSGFVLLLHVSRVLGDPSSRLEWTMLVMASVIAGAAWCAAGHIAASRDR